MQGPDPNAQSASVFGEWKIEMKTPKNKNSESPNSTQGPAVTKPQVEETVKYITLELVKMRPQVIKQLQPLTELIREYDGRHEALPVRTAHALKMAAFCGLSSRVYDICQLRGVKLTGDDMAMDALTYRIHEAAEEIAQELWKTGTKLDGMPRSSHVN
jgi:hypothetical protein